MKRRILIIIILSIFMSESIFVHPIKASTYITQEQFLQLLMSELHFVKQGESRQGVLKEAKSLGILKTTDPWDSRGRITKEMVAVFLNRSDERLHGKTYSKDLYSMILRERRISDLYSMSKRNRASVIKVYMKGIMIGYSNGYYIKSRRIKGSSFLTISEAKLLVGRVKYRTRRRKLSWDGQLIRTRNLPSNYKNYPYILETYPNSFYEKKFIYQRVKYGKTPKPLVDFACPAQIGKMKFYSGLHMQQVMDKYLETWCNKVETNMRLRFQVDYRTIGSRWVEELRKTYHVAEGHPSENLKRTNDIKNYVAQVKRNKVIVQVGRVTVEPSTLYNAGGDYVRVYVKFRVVRGDVRKMEELLYCEDAYVGGIRKNVWKECIFDIAIGSPNGYSDGRDYLVMDDKLIL